MEDKTLLACVAIAGLVIIEVTALAMGINGVLMSIMVAAIAGLGGFTVKYAHDKSKE
ncbi:hypothetical protein KKE60_04525 [Patescibacteria group bacterium]|nr:hypothetical protein [Patescibacteria group bacterium]